MNHNVLIALSLSLFMCNATLAQTTSDAAGHSPYILAVDEYCPAPGQFVNVLPEYSDGDDAASMAAKCTEAIAHNRRGIVTLGAYGGYITFHFDHPIANVDGQRDFYVAGNAIAGGAEPGIVMVAVDANGNGIPDDAWYELAGSGCQDSASLMVYDYAITYRKAAMSSTPWTDNQGRSGLVERNSYHQQEYFPLWLGDEITFTGTLLPPNGIDRSTSSAQYWARSAYRFGYVDNVSNADSLGCSFDIAWAVDAQRQPVHLDRIDFVRVYTAVNQQCGWTGETSTEVCGAEDLHLEASLAAATGILSPSVNASTAAKSSAVECYSLNGTRLNAPRRGLNIVRMPDGSVRKVASF